MDKRIFVSKKNSFDIDGINLKEKYGVNGRIYLVYDVFGIEEDQLDFIISVLCEDYTDTYAFEVDIPEGENNSVAIRLSAGQFDIRSEAVKQIYNIQFGNESGKEIEVICGTLYIGENIKPIVMDNFFNPVDSSIFDLSTLKVDDYSRNENIIVCDEFLNLEEKDVNMFKDKYSITLNSDDLFHVQKYFKEIGRAPFLLELKVLDTYWSDHTRHTTFLTELDNIDIKDNLIKDTYAEFLKDNSVYNNDKPITLMNLATINQKILKKQSKLPFVEVSKEINACSVEIKEIDGLVMFKNETHNHPTEIEPIGGASTCIGGAIRDPLSGRSYVYQALRLSGSSDPFGDEKLGNKLPQKRISVESAKGNSSYGNSIGVTTSLVKEIFDDTYIAKHLEVGAVVAYAKKENVKRLEPEDTDVVIILGGRTGRDGIGGATGSSVAHTDKSVEKAGAEVQKGNPIEERKLQRLFRNPDFAKKIKRCNDFGAGGVCVAVGELADSIDIYLHRVPLKYMGLSPVELAISESQERMAILVAKEDVAKIHELALAENIESTEVGVITDTGYLRMYYNNDLVFNISREFIDTNGVVRHVDAVIPESDFNLPKADNNVAELIESKHYASQKYLGELFDSSIGGRTVLNPYGGKYEETEEYVSTIRIPDDTDLCTSITYGFETKLSYNPFLSSYYAVMASISKLVSKGVDLKDIYLSMQEYFQSLGVDPEKWGKPLSALLGAYKAQKEMEIVAIGGKDSMSGTYEDIDVIPTLISFAVGVNKMDMVVSTDIKDDDSYIYLLKVEKNGSLLNTKDAKEKYNILHKYIKEGKVLSTSHIGLGGVAHALFNMGIGSKIGMKVECKEAFIGDILIESKEKLKFTKIGKTNDTEKLIINGHEFEYNLLQNKYTKKFKELYGYEYPKTPIADVLEVSRSFEKPHNESKVKVLIPVFPGTNCEDDMENTFKKFKNVEVKQLIIKNLNEKVLTESVDEFEKEIRNCHILALAGGFSLCDEPDGSGKFISNILNLPNISKAIEEHIDKKHLIIGICNGFQALVRSGLLDFDGTLYYNNCHKHIAKFVNTKIVNNNSPWLSNIEIGKVYKTPISHGEGRIIISPEEFERINKKGQIFSLYADEDGNVTNQSSPNGSYYAIEGLTNENGLILGKMGHNERTATGEFKNIYGNKNLPIFENAVNYIKGVL